MATLFHNCSLLGFVPFKALEGTNTEGCGTTEHRNVERDRVKSASRFHARFVTKLMMMYAAFTRYFTQPFNNDTHDVRSTS